MQHWWPKPRRRVVALAMSSDGSLMTGLSRNRRRSGMAESAEMTALLEQCRMQGKGKSGARRRRAADPTPNARQFCPDAVGTRSGTDDGHHAVVARLITEPA